MAALKDEFMRPTIRSFAITGCLLIIITSSCMLGMGEMQTAGQESSCISPPFTFAYPLTVDKEYPLPQNITPLAPWEEISAIPALKLSETTDDPNTVFSNSYEELSFVLGQEGNEELWGFRTIYSDPPPTIEKRSSLLIYNIHENKWVDNPDAFKNISREISGLYLSRDEKHIWAVSQQPTTVSVYDHKKEVFEPLKLSSSKAGIVYFDKANDRFWLFEEHKELYSIDPITAQLQFRTAIPAMPLLPSGVAIASNGDLYFVAGSSLVSGAKGTF